MLYHHLAGQGTDGRSETGSGEEKMHKQDSWLMGNKYIWRTAGWGPGRGSQGDLHVRILYLFVAYLEQLTSLTVHEMARQQLYLHGHSSPVKDNLSKLARAEIKLQGGSVFGLEFSLCVTPVAISSR